MPITETERRPYDMTDPEAMTHCSAMLVAFEARQAQFAAHDPLFGGSYAADWKAAIDLCYATATDEAMQDLQRSHTQAVEGAQAQATTAMADLRYFAQRAFGSGGYYKAFRFADHARMRQSTPHYVLYLRTQYALAQELQAPLSAKGMTPAHMAALSTAADALAATDLAQELHKRRRMLGTVDRHDRLCAMWLFAQQANAAADVIYAQQPEVRGLFGLGG